MEGVPIGRSMKWRDSDASNTIPKRPSSSHLERHQLGIALIQIPANHAAGSRNLTREIDTPISVLNGRKLVNKGCA